jgi:transposase-like protein
VTGAGWEKKIVVVAVTARRGLVDDVGVDEREGDRSRPDPEVEPKARRRTFTAAYKARILAEYEAATGPGEKGAILRRERLYSAHIVEWRRARDKGALEALSKPKGRPAADERDRELEKLRAKADRLEKELAKARLVIEIQGKVNELLETLSESIPDSSRNSPRKPSE